MKKILSLVLALVLAVSSLAALVACAPKKELSEAEKALEAASKMTLAELEAKAKEEIGANTLLYARASSTVDKAAAAFTEKYGIKAEKGVMGSKDSEMYTGLGEVMDANEYAVDLLVAQDTSKMMDFVNNGDLLNFVPNNTDGIAKENLDVLSWIYCCKQFTYTKANADDEATLYNVWQMTGKGDDGVTKFSLQDPTTEGINMSWLTMLTNEENVKALTDAYKSYFGTDWTNPDTNRYKSIAYFFIEELIGNVTTWHTSDTSTAKGMAAYLVDGTAGDNAIPNGTVGWLPYAKCKDINKILKPEDGVDNSAMLSNFEFAGKTSTMEGFSGFAYKMYIQIPRTVKYPYASALFATYLLSEEGASKSCGLYYGYYSVNANVPSADGTPITDWDGVIVEDAAYIYDNFYDVNKFVTAL